MQLDSIKIIHDTVYINSVEGYELVNKVKDFYEIAWNKLLAVGGVIIFGIPIFLALIQKIKAKKDREKFKAEINTHILSEVEEMLSKKIAEYDYRITVISKKAEASVFHLQSNFYLMHKNYLQALSDLIIACQSSFEARAYHNTQSEIASMTVNCLPNLCKEEIERKGIDIQSFYEYFKKNDQDNVVGNHLGEFMKVYKSIPYTITEKNKNKG